MIQEANERSWQEYWEEARRPGEWVDYIFIQVPGILQGHSVRTFSVRGL